MSELNFEISGLPKEFSRFESKFIPEPNSGCWLWIGSISYLGYGLILYRGRTRSAHRVSYFLYKGPINSNLEVQHSCDMRCCVNPDHLSLGDHAKNMRDSSIRKRYKNVKIGMENLASKLTDSDVLAIRETPLLKRGDQERLAEKFGVDDAIIRRIKDFKLWKHVK